MMRQRTHDPHDPPLEPGAAPGTPSATDVSGHWNAASGTPACCFAIGTTRIAVPAIQVSEVFVPRTITPVALAPPGVVGVISVRGEVAVACDLGSFFGRDTVASSTHLLLQTSWGTVSVVVDEVDEIVDVAPDSIKPLHGTVSPLAREFATGLVHLTGGLVLLTDADALVRLIQPKTGMPSFTPPSLPSRATAAAL